MKGPPIKEAHFTNGRSVRIVIRPEELHRWILMIPTSGRRYRQSAEWRSLDLSPSDEEPDESTESYRRRGVRMQGARAVPPGPEKKELDDPACAASGRGLSSKWARR
jgi:hypothetical protein